MKRFGTDATALMCILGGAVGAAVLTVQLSDPGPRVDTACEVESTGPVVFSIQGDEGVLTMTRGGVPVDASCVRPGARDHRDHMVDRPAAPSPVRIRARVRPAPRAAPAPRPDRALREMDRTRRELDRVRSEMARARAEVVRAEAELDDLRLRLRRTEVSGARDAAAREVAERMAVYELTVKHRLVELLRSRLDAASAEGLDEDAERLEAALAEATRELEEYQREQRSRR